ARLPLLCAVRVRDECLAPFIFRQRLEEIDNFGQLRRIHWRIEFSANLRKWNTGVWPVWQGGQSSARLFDQTNGAHGVTRLTSATPPEREHAANKNLRYTALLSAAFVSNCIMKTPIKVAVTGAAGHIGYALVFRIAPGQMFGPDQPLRLHQIEIPAVLGSLEGVVMELQDCAFPLLESVVATADLDEGFRDINWALLVGSVPRKAGMERKDLLGINGKIFIGQGQAIQKNAAADVRVLVVGN